MWGMTASKLLRMFILVYSNACAVHVHWACLGLLMFILVHIGGSGAHENMTEHVEIVV